jgi:hypothetical protein
MANENTPNKTIWQQLGALFKNPISILSDKTKDSPLITILAIVFVLQPVMSTSVSLVKDMIEVKQSLDPGGRPVTKSELDIVNTKIDFIQQLIVTDMQKDAASEEARAHRRSPNVVMAVPPPPAVVVATPNVASTPPTVVSSDPKSEIRSKFSDLNKKLEMIQGTLDSQYIKNAKK